MSGLKGGVAAVGGCLIVLGLAAAPAFGTTDRLDYADQANPICKSSNLQIEQLYDSTEAEIERLESVRAKNRKMARRLERRSDRLYEQLPFQVLALYQAELDGLKALAAPPGYEGTVATWLATRQEIADLYRQSLLIDQQQERGFGPVRKRPSRKAIKRRQKKLMNLGRLYDQVIDRLLTDAKTDLELGTRMGAAYCVTGATGELPSTVTVTDD
jgi:hypothetical protein